MLSVILGQEDVCSAAVTVMCSGNEDDWGRKDTFETRLIPAMTFNCHGTITGWRVAGTVGQGTKFPRVQIWRRNTTMSEGYYMSQSISMAGTVSSMEVDCAIFNHNLDEGARVSVQPGDILGIELPPSNDQAFDILYKTSAPLNYVYRKQLPATTNLQNSDLFAILKDQPLIDFNIIPGKKNIYYLFLVSDSFI